MEDRFTQHIQGAHSLVPGLGLMISYVGCQVDITLVTTIVIFSFHLIPPK